MILTTRSGTNEFHGTVFDYFRNTAMDANNWFNDDAIPQIPKAPEHHNDFGGVVGGPIWKDKTFFFASYEGARLDVPSTSKFRSRTLVLPCQSCSPSAAIAPFLEAYPKPNGAVSSATCTGEFTGSFANKATLDAGSLRIDHTFNGRFSIFGRYNDAPSQLASRTYSLSDMDTTITNTQTVTVGVNMSSEQPTIQRIARKLFYATGRRLLRSRFFWRCHSTGSERTHRLTSSWANRGVLPPVGWHPRLFRRAGRK